MTPPQISLCLCAGFEHFDYSRGDTPAPAKLSQVPGGYGTHVTFAGVNPQTGAGRPCVPHPPEMCTTCGVKE